MTTDLIYSGPAIENLPAGSFAITQTNPNGSYTDYFNLEGNSTDLPARSTWTIRVSSRDRSTSPQSTIPTTFYSRA
jgi:hypothetical protein